MQNTGTALAKASAFEIDAAESMFVDTTKEALVGSNEKVMECRSTLTFEACKNFDFVIEAVDSGVLVGANGQAMGTTKVSVNEESGRATVWAVVASWAEAPAMPSARAVEKTAARVRVQRARCHVLEDMDLVALVLSHVELDPKSFVGLGRVSKLWRAACRLDTSLLLKAACSEQFLTKRVFQGMFGLTSTEADALPHGKRAYRTGHMCMFAGDAIHRAIALIGGMQGWEKRMKRQAAAQKGLEERLGPNWRQLCWAPASKGVKRPRWG